MSTATGGPDRLPFRLIPAMAGSIVLHLTVLIMLDRASPPHEERFSAEAIEVTVEEALAPAARPAPPGVVGGGQASPPGSLDLVHTAQAPGPVLSAVPLLRPPSQAPVAVPDLSAWQAADAATDDAVRLLSPSMAAAAASTVAPRAPDALDRLKAPPRTQLQPQAPRQGLQQNPEEPSRRQDKASYASERAAEQDYVLQVVRKLSRTRFFTDDEAQRSPSGAVVVRLTVDGAGNLVDLSLAKDSGSATVDRSILDKVRSTAPFPVLPKDLSGRPFSFIVPIKYAREQ